MLKSPSDRRISAVFQPTLGTVRAFDTSLPADTRAPPKRLPQQGINADGGTKPSRRRTPSRRTSPSSCSPADLAPTPSSPLRDHRGLGPLGIFRTGPGHLLPEGSIRPDAFHHQRHERPEPLTRRTPRTVPETPFRPFGRGPVTRLPSHLSARLPSVDRSLLPGAAASRWLLLSKARKLC